MSLTINTKPYTPDSSSKDQSVYVGPLRSIAVLDNLVLGRVAPKPVKDFSGVGRSNAKLTRTLNLTGALTLMGDAIIQLGTSVPVGAADADVDALINDFAAYVASDDFKTLVKKQRISF